MQRLLYPLIASALITIVPFLLTFEKGQDIVRGLFGYEYFALLLFIIFVRGKILESLSKVEAPTSLRRLLQSPKQTLYAFIFILLCVLLFAIAWIDLQNLLAIKAQDTGWHGIVPFATCGFAIAMVWKIKPFKFNTISFILFISPILHLAALNYYAAQPLAQFPTIDYLKRIALKSAQRTNIAENYKSKYTVTDSVTITKKYIDSTRNKVIILVESWGVPLDISRFEKQIEIFNGITKTVGIHNRMYSRTRTAEREDLIKTIFKDSTGRRDTTFLPKTFTTNGYSTTFLFGGDSLEQQRFRYINKIGFNHSIYGNELDDTAMISKIDSILADSSQKHFIAWTTRDTKFPMQEFPNIYNSDADAIDTTYTKCLTKTLTLIANLARKHPKTRFIVQGDHNPILSPIKFQERFYKRWVPFVILN